MSPPRWRFVFFLSAGLGVTAQAAARLSDAGEEAAAVRMMHAGRPHRAARLLAGGSPQGDRPRRLYHLGTALLHADRPAEAATALVGALTSATDPELRRRAFHNLGLARLRDALAAPAGSGLPLALGSLAAGREALRLDPEAAGSRRNFALAQRLASRLRTSRNRPAPSDGGVQLGSPEDSEITARWDPGALPAADAGHILDALRSAEGRELRTSLERLMRGSPDRGPGVNKGRPW